jgi:stearoyl-CoA desaturase (delta-9 desaturase)
MSEGCEPQPAGRVPGERAKPLVDSPQTAAASVAMWAFVIGPLFALAAAIPFAWGWGLSARDVVMSLAGYLVSGFGVTVGYHRYFTHRAFKAGRGLRIALAVAGSLAIEGSPVQWVANHRRHHVFADRQGDPHSPWRYGPGARGLAKGLVYAHIGWMLRRELSNRARFAPDILRDRDLRVVGRLFGLWAAVSLLAPALAGGLAAGRYVGAAAPRHLVSELDLPRRRHPPLHQPRQGDQLLAAGARLTGRKLAQFSSRQSRLRPSRHHARPG